MIKNKFFVDQFWEVFGKFVKVIMPVAVAIVLFFVGFWSSYDNSEYQQAFPMNSMKHNLRILIRKRAELNQLEYYLKQQKAYSLSYNDYNILKIIKRSNFYPLNVSLETILRDIEIDVLLNDSSSVNELKFIDNLLIEIETKDPFNKLDKDQSFLFNNIVLKLDTTYFTIEPEISKIANELVHKNELVEQLGEDANFNKALSIASFLIGCLAILKSIYKRLKHKYYIYRKKLNESKEIRG
ncbi:MAG: hypothetical protein DWQ10_05845 [Calditrichaeota bacterium]|nr:MAG: hypothetical protein DWQ10_05845 [Calditrichota bacterium]